MALALRKQFPQIDRLERQMDRLLSHWRDFPTLWDPLSEIEEIDADLRMPIDVKEEDSKIIVTAELPGIDKKDIKVEVQNNVLHIRAEKKFEEEEKRKNYHRVERSYGSYHRAMSLPSSVDGDKLKAKCADGVLTVELPTKPESKAKSVPVQ